MLRSMEGEERPQLGRRVVVYGGGDTAMDAARTAKRLGATEAVVVYRRTRDQMPAHDIEVEEAAEEGVLMKWLSTVKHADEGKLVLEKMELDDTGFPQPTGEFEELEADSLVLALGQEADLSLLEGVPGIEVEDGVVQVGPNMETGHPGIFAGGDMVPAERTVTVAIGHGKQAARNIDGWLRSAAYTPPPERELGELRHAEHLVLLGRPAHRAARARGGAPARHLRRGRGRPRRVQRAVRGAPLPVLRHLLRLRQLLRRLPRQRGDQARPARLVRLRLRPRLLQGLRHLRGGVPGGRDRDGARGDLSPSPRRNTRRERALPRPVLRRLPGPCPEPAHDRVPDLHVIPIAIVYSAIVGWSSGPTRDRLQRRWSSTGTGVLFLPVLLMLLFRQKYPRWWFDWNLALQRFANRIGIYVLLMDDRYPSTDEEQSVHLEYTYPDAQAGLNRWLPLVKWFLAIPHYVVLVLPLRWRRCSP